MGNRSGGRNSADADQAQQPSSTPAECTRDGGRGRTRTGTPVSQKQILSLLCLPFHHAARSVIFNHLVARLSLHSHHVALMSHSRQKRGRRRRQLGTIIAARK